MTTGTPAAVDFAFNPNGTLGWITHGTLAINLFPAGGVEAAPANLYLRRHGADGPRCVPLLGPASPLRPVEGAADFAAAGTCGTLEVSLALSRATAMPAWFWHVAVHAAGAGSVELDLVWVQDLGLSTPGAIRLNEYYVSHYIDLSPLDHPALGTLIAARQNQPVAGRHPWLLAGSLNGAAAWATDGLQVYASTARDGRPLQPLELPGERLQHEHAMAALQSRRVRLEPGARVDLGFFALLLDDHPQASSADDAGRADAVLSLPQAQPVHAASGPPAAPWARTRFDDAQALAAHDLPTDAVDRLFGTARRHEERAGGVLQSFFHGDAAHVVLRDKELRVQRPHGHLLRSGAQLVPDESAMTSTAWMGGVFHSMVTQGHVSINRFLTTQRGWLGWFRSHGQRIFVEVDGRWQLLGLPSAFEMRPQACRWIYRHGGGLIEVIAAAGAEPDRLTLELQVLDGAPVRLLVTHHLALGGDDGGVPDAAPWQLAGDAVVAAAPPGSALAKRFPNGAFRIEPATGSAFARVGGDELLFLDGRSRGQPYLCIETAAVTRFGLRLVGALIPPAPPCEPAAAPLPKLQLATCEDVARLDEILPWFHQNALVHHLSPRGLEQFSGGGWGTRDVCQGPLEMLLALGQGAPVRDLLERVFSAQNGDGDWPQWFQFFEREREIRATDSHGDIVFWPLLALARYLSASGDRAFLDQALPFHDAAPAPLAVHVERALAVIADRRIPGTALAAYGHGDWNDSLQPADPVLRERLCSAWTVTLHHQTLTALADALQDGGPAAAQGASLAQEARRVREDFQRLLVGDGVIAGYALFAEQGGAQQPPALLLHPRDAASGVHHSLLPMMHAILEGLTSPEQAQAHLALIEAHLMGPDGARLFDAPLPYRGGPQQMFQRAETCAFFGREIGLMYTHAHLRYAQALAHMGRAEAFLDALMRVVPIGLLERVPSAGPRQSNCYYSSSDAAFPDRYEARDGYARIRAGTVRLDGGWRVYSSGPGIAVGLVIEHLLGLRLRHDALVVDPVMPRALDGLTCRWMLWGREWMLRYRIGAAGHGPLRVSCGGRDLAFVREPHPYRTGAARIARGELLAAGDPGRLELVIETA